jgi:hypothetical protein
MKKLPVAVQVYTVRQEAEKDFRGNMKQVKAMGYDGVKLAEMHEYTTDSSKRREDLHV